MTISFSWTELVELVKEIRYGPAPNVEPTADTTTAATIALTEALERMKYRRFP